MTKIATVEITVPDEVKNDDVFNFMRNHQFQGKLIGLIPNPNDPPLTKSQRCVKIVYQARGAQDAGEVESAINDALQAIKNVTDVEFI